MRRHWLQRDILTSCEALVYSNLLALVAQYELELDQHDVKTAFLHDDLEEETYMSQPMRFKTVGKENMEWTLKKSLYGLNQSLSQWYKRFDSFIRSKKYTRNHYDPCVYCNMLPSGEYIYLLLYVDDTHYFQNQICNWQTEERLIFRIWDERSRWSKEGNRHGDWARLERWQG